MLYWKRSRDTAASTTELNSRKSGHALELNRAQRDARSAPELHTGHMKMVTLVVSSVSDH